MTEGQLLAVEQLREIESRADGILEVLYIAEMASSAIVTLTLYCGDKEYRDGGIRLRNRERFIIMIPVDFPFSIPAVETPHVRFAEHPHVQWKRHLCLYQSPATEWNPADGMFGFIQRLDEWLRQASMDQLDPIGAPMHPPVAYIRSGPGTLVIPRADTPPVKTDPWFGMARLQIVSEKRVDISGWSDLNSEVSAPVGAAILLAEPMPFEFPQKAGDLVKEFQARGISQRLLLTTMQLAIMENADGNPLFMIIGTPMRGIRGSGQLKQHLNAWRIDPVVATGLRLSLGKYHPNREIREIADKIEGLVLDWMNSAPVEWCDVREDRKEVVTRRDAGTPASWFSDKAISVWGCGALGARVAEYLARAGVRKLILRDKGIVTPGLLVRQPFEDLHVGMPKSVVLAERLRAVRPALEIDAGCRNIVTSTLCQEDWTEGADVIFDTTAALAAVEKMEAVRRKTSDCRVPIVSMIVGHEAKDGMVAIIGSEYSGGPADVYRRAKLEACNQAELKFFADEFWPASRRHTIFQPEPGCSESTLVGSAADMSALAGLMFNLAARELAEDNPSEARAHFVAQPPVDSSTKTHFRFSWPSDRVLEDPHARYEIRISEPAWMEIRGWIEQSRRINGPAAETGGLLFGEKNDAAKIMWITEISGPPPDSIQSENEFVCGISGTAEHNAEKRTRTRGTVQYLGMWHTHPDALPLPSVRDRDGLMRLMEHSCTGSKSLLVIVGSPAGMITASGFVFAKSDFQNPQTSRTVTRTCAIGLMERPSRSSRIGLALSGGGARAIAFHLGCFRALHDRGILNRVQVISAVSGGAVIGAMYAYSSESFSEFDARVVDLLRRGLIGGIIRSSLSPKNLFPCLATWAIPGTAALGADALRAVLSAGLTLTGIAKDENTAWIDRIQPPLQRWMSRTKAFERALSAAIFGDKKLTDVCRGDIGVVLNACELRTGSAFRFGSKESGCWRFGKIHENDAFVSEAVAASAAYPALLPALDREYTFLDRKGMTSAKRVILTDGGVFDNLGVTCLEPGRSADFGYNTYQPEYIISCDAGQGLFSDSVYPYWWVPRMKRSFESIFRKVQNSGYERMHRYAAQGELKGFVLSYLGQQDERLPVIPPDLVRREEVANYPTDFSPMSANDLDRLTKRGEQLTRLLISRYISEL